MVYNIEHYFCDRIPEEEDVIKIFNKKRNEDCLISLTWNGPAKGFYGDDEYSLTIKPSDTVQSVMERLSKIIYAV